MMATRREHGEETEKLFKLSTVLPMKKNAGEDLSRQRVEGGEYSGVVPELAETSPVEGTPSAPPPPERLPDLARLERRGPPSREDPHLRNRQRLRELHEQSAERRRGPQGEAKSKAIVGPVRMVPLERIVSDVDFRNEVRLDPTEEEARVLEESMRHEGLKAPVVLMEGPGEDYYVRWGFRRVRAARRLGWEGIPAIVIAADTPASSQYWSNIVENLGRSKMHTYEVARAAQVMRDRFRVDYREFARRTGLTPKYVDNLLRAADNLPPVLMQKWRERRPIPVDHFFQWGAMRPEEAVTAFNTYVGLHPRAQRPAVAPPGTGPATPRAGKREHPLLAATRYGLRRMDRLRFAVASCPALGEEERGRVLAAVDFCMGQREDVPGVYDDRARRRSTRGRDGRRVRVRVNDVASFHLIGPGDPLDVPPKLVAELEASARGLNQEQVERLMATLKKDL